MKRLVTVIRQDLSSGYQIAQSIHSAVEFTLTHPIKVEKWHNKSNYVLVLGVTNEAELHWFITRLDYAGRDYKVFYEPDIDQETSVTFISNDLTDEFTKDMPLAGIQNDGINMNLKQS